MVGNITSLTNNGLRDWLIQRLSAVILAAYALFLLVTVCVNDSLDYFDWVQLFQHQSMRIFTALALLALMAHAWIGFWTVLTDYIKGTGLRVLLELAFLVLLISCLIWGFTIIWGI